MASVGLLMSACSLAAHLLWDRRRSRRRAPRQPRHALGQLQAPRQQLRATAQLRTNWEPLPDSSPETVVVRIPPYVLEHFHEEWRTVPILSVDEDTKRIPWHPTQRGSTKKCGASIETKDQECHFPTMSGELS